MKSDVIRKRARHEGRKGSSPSDTPPSESTQTSPVMGASMPPPIQDIHPPMLPSSFDFSAAGFEFSQVTHDSTDRLTYQHDLDRDAALRMTLSPGTTYLESLNYPGSASAYSMQSFYSSDSTTDRAPGNNGNHSIASDSTSADAPTTGAGQAAFQDDGFKRRRVSPEGDGNASAEAEDAFGTVEEPAPTSYDVPKPPIFDGFNAYYPYPFTFTSAPNLFHPPMAYLPEDQIDVGEAMETAVASIRTYEKGSDSPKTAS